MFQYASPGCQLQLHLPPCSLIPGVSAMFPVLKFKIQLTCSSGARRAVLVLELYSRTQIRMIYRMIYRTTTDTKGYARTHGRTDEQFGINMVGLPSPFTLRKLSLVAYFRSRVDGDRHLAICAPARGCRRPYLSVIPTNTWTPAAQLLICSKDIPKGP